MDTKQQTEQLRLAADLIEHQHPFEFRMNSKKEWRSGSKEALTSVPYMVAHYFEVRPLLIQPPEALTLHNPDNLTGEQVGVGWRLLCREEAFSQGYQYWDTWVSLGWEKGERFGKSTTTHNQNNSMRVPSTTPWPEVPKSDPFAELKKAHAEGKVIQYGDDLIGWSDFQKNEIPAWTSHPFHYRIKPWFLPPPPEGKQWMLADKWTEEMLPEGYRPLLSDESAQIADEWRDDDGKWISHGVGSSGIGFPMNDGQDWVVHRTRRPLPAEKKKVPLGPEDVPPGSVLSVDKQLNLWAIVTEICEAGLRAGATNKLYTWNALMERGCEILRPGKTEWEPCWKEVDV